VHPWAVRQMVLMCLVRFAVAPGYLQGTSLQVTLKHSRQQVGKHEALGCERVICGELLLMGF
jgi:hypothetical protein